MKSLVEAIKEHTPEKTYIHMTLREYAAVAAMQGILSNGQMIDSGDATIWVVDTAVSHADALIAKLEEGK